MQYGPEERPKKGKKTKDYKLHILLLQTTAAAVVLLAALGLRFFGGELYLQLRQVYYGAVNDTTRVEEVTQPASSEESTSSEPATGQSTQPTGYTLDFSAVQVGAQVSAKGSNTLLWPVQGKVTSPYGYRKDPFTGQRAMHWGIDIGAESGTPIVSVTHGQVIKVAENDSYGKYIMVRHNDNLTTLYAHCSAIDAKEGQNVRQGQQIARVGSTGRSTGPHLHFETRVGGQKINPEWLLGPRVQV